MGNVFLRVQVYFVKYRFKNVIKGLESEYFVSNNADIDSCCVVKSKVFVQVKGFFSQLIVEIREKKTYKMLQPRRMTFHIRYSGFHGWVHR